MKYLTNRNKNILNSSINSTKNWLDSLQKSEIFEYNSELRELKDVCDPILDKIYNQGNHGQQIIEELWKGKFILHFLIWKIND